MRPWRAVILALAAVSLPLSCARKRAPSLADVVVHDAGTGGEDAGLMLGDTTEIPSGPCGEQSIPAITNPPNISFIIDHSASMGDELADSGLSKYENARVALSHVLKAVGHRINYGATVFPGLADVTGCEAGDELMKVAPGDPPSYALAGTSGPRLKDLLKRLSIASVDGGTPAAPTLSKSLTALQALEGETYVVLITDGAPNCNADLFCTAQGCIPNIEGLSAGGLDCRTGVNCCEPTGQFPDANLSCIDAQATLDAVQALSDAGISTFVVGMPGSEPYERLLSSMAEIGGTARAGDLKYYSVSDIAALEESLKAIAASISISCDLPLDYEPPDPDFVNVYFDGVLVEYDPEAGWEWTKDGHVAIRGASCDELSAGDVLEVQILAGCKTVVK
jgi:hypothetical protein